MTHNTDDIEHTSKAPPLSERTPLSEWTPLEEEGLGEAVAIIGGGLAGLSLSILLSKAGHKVGLYVKWIVTIYIYFQ